MWEVRLFELLFVRRLLVVREAEGLFPLGEMSWLWPMGMEPWGDMPVCVVCVVWVCVLLCKCVVCLAVRVFACAIE